MAPKIDLEGLKIELGGKKIGLDGQESICTAKKGGLDGHNAYRRAHGAGRNPKKLAGTKSSHVENLPICQDMD